MQVSVETTQGLQRRMTVQVPAAQIENEISERLRSLTKTAKVAGFRPGKVPPKVVHSKFGSQVRQEVIGETLQKSFMDAVRQEKLHLVAEPKIDNIELKAGEGLQYNAVFEVFPEVAIAPLEDIQIVKPVVAIEESKIDEVITNLRRQQVSWNNVSREAALEDRVLINFTGSIEGEAFEGNQGNEVSVILGSNTMIPGFETQLLGVKAGESVVLNLTFPADYRATSLSGKAVQFQVEVLSVFAPELPVVDETFIKNMGVEDGTEASLRAEIQQSLTQKVTQLIANNLKDQVVKSLLALHTFELPAQLITDEIEILKKQTPDLADETLQQQAHSRVMLGMLFGKIIEENKLTVNRERVLSMVQEMADSYEQSQRMIELYLQDKNRLAVIERLVMEEQIVDWVLQRAHVSEESLSFDELYQNSPRA